MCDQYPKRLGFVLFSCGLFLLVGDASRLTAQVFTVDPAQTSLTISGTVAGGGISNQAPGSLTTTFSGSIQTALSGNTIQFTGQSQILAETNGTWQPKADGTAGSEPADFGGRANLGIATGVAALRNIQFDAFSPPISVNAGQFDSSSLVYLFPSNALSSLAYNVTGFINKSGTLPLTGYATNKVTTLGSLSTVGSQQVLTIPVDATFYFKLITDNDTVIRLQGQLVAVANGSSQFVIQSAVQGQSILLQWQANAAEQVQVQSSMNLFDWQTNATIVAPTQGVYSWTGTISGPVGFFRLAK